MNKLKNCVEPSQKEIKMMTTTVWGNSLELLEQLHLYCFLSSKETAKLLSIELTDLKKYKNGDTDMQHKNFCKFVSIYMAFINLNHIAIPSQIRNICEFFTMDHRYK